MWEKYPESPWAEKAELQFANTRYAEGVKRSGKSKNDVFQETIKLFEAFEKKYPASPFIPDAKFGTALCLEEMDRLEDAYAIYETLQTTYPSPQVIEIKLVRIQERRKQKKQ